MRPNQTSITPHLLRFGHKGSQEGTFFFRPGTILQALPWPPQLRSIHNLIAILLATNYFLFQIELFEDEYEANHPKRCETCSVTLPTLSWESFDKENAPEAFVFDAGIRSEFLFLLEQEPVALHLPFAQYQPIRDKSPPAL